MSTHYYNGLLLYSAFVIHGKSNENFSVQDSVAIAEGQNVKLQMWLRFTALTRIIIRNLFKDGPFLLAAIQRGYPRHLPDDLIIMDSMWVNVSCVCICVHSFG